VTVDASTRGLPVTTLLERVPLADINAQAREWHPLRFVLTVLAGLLFGLGWVAAKTVAAVVAGTWLAGAWVSAAVLLGWRSARGS